MLNENKREKLLEVLESLENGVEGSPPVSIALRSLSECSYRSICRAVGTGKEKGKTFVKRER